MTLQYWWRKWSCDGREGDGCGVAMIIKEMVARWL